jgi:predicted enzyme related to lactoylglutathione lyase
MKILGIYAAIAASEMSEAEKFYSNLFGRGPDDRPMDGLIQWRDVAGANIQLFRSKENAGSSMCTIVVPDMEMARSELAAVNLSFDGERQGDFGKIAKISDPDGNVITLAEPPKGA